MWLFKFVLLLLTHNCNCDLEHVVYIDANDLRFYSYYFSAVHV